MENATIEDIKKQFADSVLSSQFFRGEKTIIVKRERVFEIAKYLKDVLEFDFLMDLTAVDHYPEKPRFEVVYNFYSFPRNERIRMKSAVDETNCVASSLSGLWHSANWLEREVYDMFGIKFTDHPDLRRILMYDTFEGYPLRKDYPLKKRQPRIKLRNDETQKY